MDSRKHHVEISNLPDEEVGKGTSKKAVRVAIEVSNGVENKGTTRRKIHTLVAKKFFWKTTKKDNKFLELEDEIRCQLRAKGVPVIATNRLDPATRTVYQTDLSEGGSKRVLSAMPQEHVHPANDEKIPTCSNASEVLKNLCEICTKVVAAGFYFSNPDALYFIIDKKTGRTDVLVGDYKHLNKFQTARETLSPEQGLLWCRCGAWAAMKKLEFFLHVPEEDVRAALKLTP